MMLVAVAGDARGGDVLHRLEVGAGVVLVDPDEEAGQRHATTACRRGARW